jgi:zinc D-Ala-D-Ala carboxypeptidase
VVFQRLAKRSALRSLALIMAAGLPFVAVVATPGTASASTCNTTAKNSWANNCTIGEGNSSNMVTSLQRFIKDFYGCSPSLAIDGDFGPNTQAAVECVQGVLKIQVDGIVGPQTWGALYKYQGSAGCSQPSLTYTYFSPAGPCDWRQNDSTGVWGVVGLHGTWVTMNFSGPS